MIVPLLSVSSIVLLAVACHSQTVMDQTATDRNARVRGCIERERADGEFPGVQYVVLSRNSTLFLLCQRLGGYCGRSGSTEEHDHDGLLHDEATTAAAVLQADSGRGKIS